MKFNEIFSKKEVKLNPDEHLEAIVQSLRGLPGPEFINRLRKVKAENPNLETLMENYTEDKRFKKDIINGLFFLRKEDPNHEWSERPEFLKQIEHYYYPENTRSDRRHMRRLWGTMLGTLGGLALTSGILFHQMKKDEKEQEDIEKSWEKQKLPLSIDDIKKQADTLFQSLNGNMYLFEAYDTLGKVVEKHFDQAHIDLERNSKTQITDYLDSLHLKSPEIFKNLVLEYWKSKNQLPSNYNELVYYPGRVSEPIREVKLGFKQQQENLEKEEKNLVSRLRAAYISAGGNTYEWHEAVEQVKQQEESKTKENPEYQKFTQHVDSIAKKDSSIVQAYEKFSNVVNGSLGNEIRLLKEQLDQSNKILVQEEKEIQDKINGERDQKIQNLRNQNSIASQAEIKKQSESFNEDVWNYLEDYYLVNEVFDYDFKDTTSENSLKAMEQESSVKQALKKLLTLRDILGAEIEAKITDITARSESEKNTILRDVRSKAENGLTSIRKEFELKNNQYQTEITETLDEYNKKYNQLWNQELKNQNITTILPRE